MRVLRLLWLVLPLAACQATPPMVDASQYACPDGQVLRAGVTSDQRLLRLTVAGRTYTLRQRQDGYSNGYFTARRDDLFLHLHRVGDLLPRHCRLVINAGSPDPAPASFAP